ncbi:Fic family protein [Limnohabitans sp. Rim8]|uniref:Fic family protein n=1 Tax=Limnohabitans sp. Rim8 TaxID=1100718 RepID=UPI003306740C
MFEFQPPRISSEILSLISNINEFKGAWRAYGTISPERLDALKHVATIESIGSSTRIEGSKLSDREVEKLLAGLSSTSFESRDEQEVAGYAKVMELVFTSWEYIPFNENHIQQLHRDLLTYVDKDEGHRGNYKTHENKVVARDTNGKVIGIVFETAYPFDTPRLMADLVAWFRMEQESRTLHPLLAIAVFIVTFLAIHPFEDGNGRLSRVLTTLLLLQAGYAYVPYSSLESVIEQNKGGYYIALHQTQITIHTEQQDWEPWLLFFLRSLHAQVKRLEKKVENEKTVLAALPDLSLKILELTRERGRLTLKSAVELTRANRNTAKLHLQKLLGAGHLKRHGAGRGVWYGLA